MWLDADIDIFMVGRSVKVFGDVHFAVKLSKAFVGIGYFERKV